MLGRKLKSAARYWREGGLGSIARVAADRLAYALYPLLPPLAYKSLRMLFNLGYWPNISSPRTLNEKVARRQLLIPHPLASLVADKWRVRDYVAGRGLARILNEVYFVTDMPERIPFDDLPDRFVIKANHASGWNIFVTDKHALDRQKTIRQCRRWLGLKYGRISRNYDTHYDSIAPVILVERFLDDQTYGIPLDYKIDCFHGKALYIGVRRCSGEGDSYSRYDADWNQLRFTAKGPYKTSEHFPRPPRLKDLLEAAERLSAELDYCRVDLYLVNGEELLFGEITMHPDGGLNPISREWDVRLGELW